MIMILYNVNIRSKQMGYKNLSNFEKKLGQFADKIDIIVGLEIGNKISPEDAYQKIKELYKELKDLRKVEKNNWTSDIHIDV